MNKCVKLQKLIIEAQDFIGHNLTCDDSKFEAWNNSLLRFIRTNYDKETYKNFENRYYSLSCFTFTTPKSEFVDAFEHDIYITIEELKLLLEEEKEQNTDLSYLDNKMYNNTDIIVNLFKRFHLICRQLCKRHDSRKTININDEYDVQDLMHALLYIYFDDIRAEEWTPSFAGGCSRQDFLLKNEKIVIELKKTRKGLKDKQIGEQLIIDIEHYKTHPDCKTLLCFVYDPDGIISNSKALENDLTKETDGMKVITIINQK